MKIYSEDKGCAPRIRTILTTHHDADTFRKLFADMGLLFIYETSSDQDSRGVWFRITASDKKLSTDQLISAERQGVLEGFNVKSY